MEGLLKLLAYLTATLFPLQILKGNSVIFVGKNSSNTKKLSIKSDFHEIYDTRFFGPEKPSVLFFHDWDCNIYSESTAAIIEGFLIRRNFNILIADWSKFAKKRDYEECARSVVHVAHTYVELLMKLNKEGYDMGNLYLVGHGLGAQICGAIGRELKADHDARINRITGLDPVDYLFHPSETFSISNIYVTSGGRITLSRNDARFVDIIHTNAGRIGTKLSTGDMDFWPNGRNSVQPACQEICSKNPNSLKCDVCNHDMAWRYYVDSMDGSTHKFMSKLCKNGWNYTKESCESDIKSSMGYRAERYNNFGNFFVATRDKSPHYDYWHDYYHNHH